ncbi:hypothetical protein CHS0354_010824 [Potamilus streckersoni]|uniref:Uncharacterized protein n=1 Tax=Potamilus streckersoni TaxID=2493646 RepID=A0AAE0TA22_9BIVA|nr:hypothetical protein CHS0354_010824 [Potamilus streckersoni]
MSSRHRHDYTRDVDMTNIYFHSPLWKRSQEEIMENVNPIDVNNRKEQSARKVDNTYEDNTDINNSIDSIGKKTFRQLIVRFAEKTSMQGVPYIKSSTFWWSRLIWVILTLGAIAAMVFHLYTIFYQYYQWPKQTKISLGFDNLQFPAVTICNVNIMRKSQLHLLQGQEADKLKDFVYKMNPDRLKDPKGENSSNPVGNSTGNTGTSGNPTDNTGSSESSISNTVTPGNATGSASYLGNSTSSTGVPFPPATPAPSGRRKRFVDYYKQINRSAFDDYDYEDEYSRDEVKTPRDTTNTLEKLFTKLYMTLSRDQRASAGHNITDMLVSCSFNGRECYGRNFTLYQTSQYGNCWTLDSDKLVVRSPGPNAGLSLILYLENSEFLTGINQGYGARLVIHEPQTVPSPYNEGVHIASAEETSVAIRKVTITRLSTPYGDCDDGISFMASYGINYTRQSCQLMCQAIKILETCGCYDDDGEELIRKSRARLNLKPCRNGPEIRCRDKLNSEFEGKEQVCNCYNPCYEAQYSRSTGSRQWPTDEYAGVLLESLCEKDNTICQSFKTRFTDQRSQSQNFIKLNIYYADLNFEYIEETPQIEAGDFLANIGGVIGLWIGLSVLSLCEVLQLVAELFTYCIYKASHKVRPKQKRNRDNSVKSEHYRAEDNVINDSPHIITHTRYGLPREDPYLL